MDTTTTIIINKMKHASIIKPAKIKTATYDKDYLDIQIDESIVKSMMVFSDNIGIPRDIIYNSALLYVLSNYFNQESISYNAEFAFSRLNIPFNLTVNINSKLTIKNT